MPKVSDKPKYILIKDLSEEELRAFQKIKEKFEITANNVAVKLLFTKYLHLLQEYSNLNTRLEELKQKNIELNGQIKIVRDFSKFLNNIEENEKKKS